MLRGAAAGGSVAASEDRIRELATRLDTTKLCAACLSPRLPACLIACLSACPPACHGRTWVPKVVSAAS